MQDQSDNGVYETLAGHEGLVTCVRFLRNDFLVSADDKGHVRFWQNSEKVHSLSLHHTLSDATVTASGEIRPLYMHIPNRSLLFLR